MNFIFLFQVMQSIRVGDWVEVEEDLSVDYCSEGGAGMVINIVDGRADVKYIMGGRTEKNISNQRMVGIPMPYRGVKATTRTTSATHKPKGSIQTTSPEISSLPFNKMTNAVQRLKFGLPCASEAREQLVLKSYNREVAEVP
jgi:hypothetical protein